MKVKDILNFLESKFPVSTACEFDNVGLLVGDGEREVKNAMVALDCDITAVNKAREAGAQLIITHHPVIFDGLKAVTAGSIVYELIKSGISVISMHTNLDIAEGGVTECLCEAIGLTDIKPFTANDGFVIREAVCPISDAEKMALHIKESLGGGVRYVAGKTPINRVLVCSGSGGDFLADAINCGFDALITADVKHNVFIDAINNGISLFDAGHYASENVIVEPLAELLSEEFKSVKFIQHSPHTIKSL